MNDNEDFEDWSHPTPVLKIPRHRPRISWGFLFAWIAFVAMGLVFWYGVYRLGVAYRIVQP